MSYKINGNKGEVKNTQSNKSVKCTRGTGGCVYSDNAVSFDVYAVLAPRPGCQENAIPRKPINAALSDQHRGGEDAMTMRADAGVRTDAQIYERYSRQDARSGPKLTYLRYHFVFDALDRNCRN